MKTALLTIVGLVTAATSLALPALSRRGSISITPHDQYSSSVGVLGCKINTNRVAYWPSSPSCNGMCVKVSANGRSVNLLKVDGGGSAYDISYDAWNYLSTGQSATADPTTGGGIAATYEDVDMNECAGLITTADNKLAFSAANSVSFVASCPSDSWVAQNYVFYNIANPTCNYGVNEVCTLDMSVSNQPSCPGSQLGVKTPLDSQPVYNIIYGTGEKALATT